MSRIETPPVHAKDAGGRRPRGEPGTGALRGAPGHGPYAAPAHRAPAPATHRHPPTSAHADHTPTVGLDAIPQQEPDHVGGAVVDGQVEGVGEDARHGVVCVVAAGLTPVVVPVGEKPRVQHCSSPSSTGIHHSILHHCTTIMGVLYFCT